MVPMSLFHCTGKGWLAIILGMALLAFTVIGCPDDDDDDGGGSTQTPNGDNGNGDKDPGRPIVGFTCEVDAQNDLKVNCSNSSEEREATDDTTATGALTYLWDFGVDGSEDDTSTEENPSYTYAAEGDYAIRLTATGAESGGASFRTASVRIRDTGLFPARLAGAATDSSKTWYLTREEGDGAGLAMGVYPSSGFTSAEVSNSWWIFSSDPALLVGDHTTLDQRPCILNDEYIFKTDANGDIQFVVDTMDDFWVDLQGVGGHTSESGANMDYCADEIADGATVADIDDDIWEITRTIEATEQAMIDELPKDEDNNPTIWDYRNKSGDINQGGYTVALDRYELIITGRGHYIGLISKSNEGDGDRGYLVPETRVFTIVDLTEDYMRLRMDAAGAVWIFDLHAYEHNGGTLPAIPEPECTGDRQAVDLPIDFEDPYPNISNWGASVGTCAENPAQSVNTSAQVGKINGASGDTGVWIDTASAFDFGANDCGFQIDFYTDTALNLTFKLEDTDSIVDQNPPTIFSQVDVAVSTTGSWHTVDIDLTSVVPSNRASSYERITILPNADVEFYIDNIRLHTAAGACEGSG